MKYIYILVMALMILAGCQQPITGEVVKEAPVKIGAILTLTSWGAYWGEGAARGIDLAEKDINQNEKQKVEVIIEDSQTSNNGAINAANKLLNIDDVDIVYVEFTGPSTSIAPLVQKHNKVLMYSALPSQLVETEDNTIKTYFDDYDECAKLTEHAIQEGHRKIAFYSVNLAFAKPCQQAIEDTIEGTNAELVFAETFNIETTDFRTDLLKIDRSQAEVMISIMYEDHAINLLRQKKELEIDIPLYCGGKNDCLTDKVLEEIDHEILKGSVTFDFDIDERFIQRYKQIYPGAGEVEMQAAALAYDGIKVLYEVQKNCKDKECIMKTLEGKQFQTVVSSDGFENRRMQLNTDIKEFNGEEFVKV